MGDRTGGTGRPSRRDAGRVGAQRYGRWGSALGAVPTERGRWNGWITGAVIAAVLGATACDGSSEPSADDEPVDEAGEVEPSSQVDDDAVVESAPPDDTVRDTATVTGGGFAPGTEFTVDVDRVIDALPDDPSDVVTCDDLADAAADYLQATVYAVEQYGMDGAALTSRMDRIEDAGVGFDERGHELDCDPDAVMAQVAASDVDAESDFGRVLIASMLGEIPDSGAPEIGVVVEEAP